MATREEYEDAIKKIREAFYSAICEEWELEQIAVNLDFLSSLINEHFKEHPETNYEHYKDEIIEDYSQNLAVVKGRPTLCYKTNCNNCDFKINQIGCREKAKDWLKQPYKKTTYKLTKFEIDLLQSCSQGYSPKYQFKNINSLTEMRKNGYFKCINRDETIEEILEKSEVVG